MYKKIAILVLLISISFTQEKIGVVYSERIVLEYEEFKDVEEQLRLEFGDKIKEFEAMQAELDSMGRINEDSLKMSAELKKAKETEIIEMQQNMQNYSLVFNNELTKREQQLEYELVQKYKKAVDSVATKQGYTIVIDGSAATLYVNPKLNITDDVLYELRKLNEENSSTE
ncbi:MAG: hypothetical protein Ct9H300mP18_05380 [Candidatus Neomarinimicrobiota bacterium]|nr:MAG: hypothetical protein Ct9H300mP18_05380 [Candidatus Neomarinimicrobiota bacterium]